MTVRIRLTPKPYLGLLLGVALMLGLAIIGVPCTVRKVPA